MKKSSFPPELLNKIKAATNIVEVIGEHVVLRKSGSNYVGLCPFHSERSSSFYVSEPKQLYHCHGCKKGGDILQFIMEMHGISFPEAIEELADRARIPIPAEARGAAGADPDAQKKREEAQEKSAVAFKVNRFVAAFYHSRLKDLADCARYFARRGVGEEMIRDFYLGGAAPEWDALAKHLVAKKAPVEVAQALGLIRTSTKAAGQREVGFFDLFRNRAIFPILDLRGRVVGFGGRALGPDDNPKYLNSPESIAYQKSKVLFGLFQAQKHIREKDEAIVVEGYFDVIAMHAAGFKHVVATCGTALTPEHLKMLRKFGQKITILFDGDRAGISATERAMELGLEHGLVLYGASLPEGLDPDELLFDDQTGKPLEGGVAKMQAVLDAAKPLLDTQIAASVADAVEGPEARAQALKRIAGWLSRFKDPVGVEVRMESVCAQLGCSRDLLTRAMGAGAPALAAGPGRVAAPSQRAQASHAGAMARPSGVLARPTPNPTSSSTARPAAFQPRRGRATAATQLTPSDKILLAGMMRGGEFARCFAESQAKLPPGLTVADLFDYPAARDWVRDQGFDASAWPGNVASCADAQVRSTLTEAAVAGGTPVELEDFKLALGRALEHVWARFSQQIKSALNDAEAKKDAELHAQLLQQYLDVRRKMKEFISFYDEA